MKTRIALVMALAIAPACYFDIDTGAGSWETDTESDDWTWDTGSDGPVDVRDATLAGAMGDVRLGGDVYETRGDHWGSSLSVTMYARGEFRGEGMAQITIDSWDGDLVLTPGTRFDSAESSGVFISALGCSGDDRDLWTFDQSPEETTVEVRTGASPNERRLDYRMRFSDGNVATGSYTVEVNPATDRLE